MRMQVQEMLRTEKGGAEQLGDELAAHNSMIPGGQELNATLMFEIDDENRRKVFLNSMGGVKQMIFIDLNGERISAEPEQDVDRTSQSGKAGAV